MKLEFQIDFEVEGCQVDIYLPEKYNNLKYSQLYFNS